MPLTYNGITLPFVKTDALDHEFVYSEDHADYLYTKTTIRITSTLTAHTPGVLLPGETLADAVTRIKHMLEQPRKSLLFVTDGEHVAADAASDVNNGPFPNSLSIVRMTGTESVVVQFSVTCHTNECPEGHVQPSGVLSHRFRERIDIDGTNFRSKRTRSGLIRIRGGAGLNPDAFRWRVTPPIPTGFTRASSSYELQTDGLAMSYEFVDEEQFAMPPPPATKAWGVSRVTSERGIFRDMEVQIRLTGDVKTPKEKLISVAIAVAVDQLERAGLAKSKRGKWLARGAISVHHYDVNQVEISLRSLLAMPRKPNELANRFARIIATAAAPLTSALIKLIGPSNKQPGDPETPDTGTPLPKAFSLDAFKGLPLYSDGNVLPPDPGLRSTAGLAMVAAMLNDPCLGEAVAELRGGNVAQGPSVDEVRLQKGTAVRDAALKATLSLVTQIGDSPLPGNDDGLMSALYTDYRIILRYKKDHHYCMLPQQKQGGTTSFSKLSADTMTLVAEWTAERAGEPPEVPSVNLGDDNAVCLTEEYDPCTPEIADNGVDLIFRSSGRYVYGFRDPAKVTAGAGILPWIAELLGKQPSPTIYGGPELIDIGDEDTSELVANPNATGLQVWQQNLNNWISDSGNDGTSELVGGK